MSLLGEELIEEWLNRDGFFTIRGIRIGNSEIDILAIKPLPDGKHECRHIEVQLSVNPISYFSFHNAKRLDDLALNEKVREWIEKKFDHPKKVEVRQRLCNEVWTKELVVQNIRYPEEIDACKKAGIEVHWLWEVLVKMLNDERENESVIHSATGGDLFQLVLAGNDMSGTQRLLGKVVGIEENRGHDN
jgi:hypothetical protein